MMAWTGGIQPKSNAPSALAAAEKRSEHRALGQTVVTAVVFFLARNRLIKLIFPGTVEWWGAVLAWDRRRIAAAVLVDIMRAPACLYLFVFQVPRRA
jgi:hypothetical protein